MKVWHILVAITIFSVIITAFVGFGSDGLLRDLQDHYDDKSEVNLTVFGSYNNLDDVRSVSSDIQENSTQDAGGVGQDVDQGLIAKLRSIGRDSTQLFPAAYKLVNNAVTDLGLNVIFMTAFGLIVGFWIAIKGVEFAFGR